MIPSWMPQIGIKFKCKQTHWSFGLAMMDILVLMSETIMKTRANLMGSHFGKICLLQ